MGGRGERISAGANGTAWVVNDSGEIWQWRDGEFHLVPGGNAMDIGANADGQVWIVGRASGGSRGGPETEIRTVTFVVVEAGL